MDFRNFTHDNTPEGWAAYVNMLIEQGILNNQGPSAMTMFLLTVGGVGVGVAIGVALHPIVRQITKEK